ncbi:glycogen-binding domain-containing protein [Desulfosarcina ovata]|uniref:AMP-activated protein kinase glycogen-binding domain-containing protein n=1 Tax=Desulfosarcina ovata subsp. ovata TaxID=2752305 RepID=A0A5K8AI96_9BACT|nr:glycogen-binding domain-containing protein [Desulfosarcina ovata]BBO92196.1 hypothetical protein DSCOOX_53760 [Desulfosarcina ovata subsp. ovata]
MDDFLASMYIDNELDLDEKVQFVDKIHSEQPFYQDTRELLLQEKRLRMPVDMAMLPDRPPVPEAKQRWLRRLIRPVAYATAGFAFAALLLFVSFSPPAPAPQVNRFVIYEPSARQVELAGSFTGWQRRPLQPVGNSGYWEVQLKVPSGEHRFAYILDGDRQMADPTLPGRERDDFGGENSILTVEGQV